MVKFKKTISRVLPGKKGPAQKILNKVKQTKAMRRIKQISDKATRDDWMDYLQSTHFWGPVANWGIPVAAIADIVTKDASVISPNMTCALLIYSALFMRFALRVQPRNMLLFACHVTNEGAQLVQAYRYHNYRQALAEI